MIKTGECYFFDDRGRLNVAESFVENGTSSTEIELVSFSIVSAEYVKSEFANSFWSCLVDWTGWGCSFVAVEGSENETFEGLRESIIGVE